eukprot:SAG31_NODE_43604_length_266_cov_0.916168_1_plen_35_part_10
MWVVLLAGSFQILRADRGTVKCAFGKMRCVRDGSN